MAKDPALLFYFQDWQGGTMLMSRFLKGCYMDLLCAQFNNGHLSLDEIKTFLGSDFGTAWPALQKKFTKDDKELYYNKRLEDEQLRRKSFTKSRRENLNGSAHMETETKAGNELEKRKEEFRKVVFARTEYKPEMLQEFFDYWSEHKPQGRRMRFEMEKVFDINRRLSTWKKKQDEYGNGKNNFQGAQHGRFPNYFDAALYAKLGAGSDMSLLQKYQQHLRSIGYRFINQEWQRQTN